MKNPVIRHIAAQWSMVHYPDAAHEWSLHERLAAAKAAGFDGIAHSPQPDLANAAREHGLVVLGYISSNEPEKFAALLEANKTSGAHHINVQLADEDTLTPAALAQTMRMMAEGRRLGVEPAIEVHRDTCTETPEKTYALADAYHRATGELLPMTWDFSHLAVVKHLAPSDYIEKLIIRPDLIQRAQQFHFRPFNGHHCQIPVTDGEGNLTAEVKDWFPFAHAVLKCWLEGNQNTNREIFVCPEMGPVPGGYNLSTLPNSWEDAKILRIEIERMWRSLLGK
jgi:sugar phosphate isomerase/epimerase